ncbi:MAG: D-alanine--D-alanine ligase [Blastocatellia bacterium]
MKFKSKRKLRVIVLVREDLVPPDSLEGYSEKDVELMKTEFDVVSTLKSIGHDVWPVGVRSELSVIREAIEEHKPHVAFNLLEEFDGYPLFDQHMVSYLELKKQKYTGCNPRGLTLSHDKALTKKILAYHRIPVPRFAVFSPNRKVRRPNRLTFPLFVKSVIDEGSVGISQASIVRDDEKLAERVDFIHRQTGSQAIAEQFIEGREIYVGVIGNKVLQAFPPWELLMKDLPDGAQNIATDRAKWDPAYQRRVGLVTGAARLTAELQTKFEQLSKRIYRLLNLTGYARLDYRLTESGRIYLIEANANPQIARKEDFADSAEHTGVKYEALLQKILTLGMSYEPA